MATAYKNKIYTGKTITWNQIADFGTLYGEGQYSSFSGRFKTTDKVIKGHKYFFYSENIPAYGGTDAISLWHRNENNTPEVWITHPTNPIAEAPEDMVGGVNQSAGHFWLYGYKKYSSSNILLCDLTLMFGESNEPTTPEEFWSHFERKHYDYNTGESQPLFLISRKRKIKSSGTTLTSYKTKIFETKDMLDYQPIYNSNEEIIGYSVGVLSEFKSAISEITSSDILSVYNEKPVTRISEKGFMECSNLKSITIPDSVTLVWPYAFYACKKLASITIGSGVTAINDYAFSKCDELTSITVNAENATYHSNGNCIIKTKSKTLVLGCKNSVIPTDGSVTSIGYSAFYGCTGLTSITIPNSVTSIGYSVFMNCTGLTNITIPNSVTSIGGSAFYGCTGLTSITIPNNVKWIGGYAFYGCANLASLKIASATPPSLNAEALQNTPTSLQIIVPKGTLDAYKSATNWSKYADQMVEADE